MLLPNKPQSLRNVIESSFRLYFSGLTKVLPLTFVFGALAYFMQPNGKPAVTDSMDGLMLLLFLVALYFLSTLHVAILLMMKGSLLGQTVTAIEAIKRGFKRAIGVCIVGFVVEVIALIPAMIFYVIAVKLFPTQLLIAMIISGLIALYVLVYLYLAPFIYVIYDKKILESIKESYYLVKNHWWRACLLMSVLSLVALIVSGVVLAIFSPLLGWLYKDFFVLAMLLLFLLLAVLLPYWYSTILVLIWELKVRDGSNTGLVKKK